jgi:hypothetical protein
MTVSKKTVKNYDVRDQKFYKKLLNAFDEHLRLHNNDLKTQGYIRIYISDKIKFLALYIQQDYSNLDWDVKYNNSLVPGYSYLEFS